MENTPSPNAEEYEEQPHLLQLLIAHAYLDAAALVAVAKPQDDLDYIQVVATQLLAQGLELTFKAFLSWSGVPEKELESQRHDLAGLMALCQKLLLDIRPVDTIVARISEGYANHWYRYPSPGDVPLVDMTFAVPLCRQLWKTVETLGTQDSQIEIHRTGKPPLLARERRKGVKTRPDLSQPRD